MFREKTFKEGKKRSFLHSFSELEENITICSLKHVIKVVKLMKVLRDADKQDLLY
jgi:hypothetical protein